MKGKKIIIVSIIINIILIGIIYNFINRNYLNNDKLILKAMTETEYEAQIASLNQEHQDYLEYIADSKTQLADSITYMGVETSNLDSLETMASNIRNISNNGGKIGTVETIILNKSYTTYDLQIPLSKLNGIAIISTSTNRVLVLYVKQINETKWYSGYGLDFRDLDSYSYENIIKFNITENQFQYIGNGDGVSGESKVYYF